MSQKRLALVCQHFYPEMVSTGLHMTELARRLRKREWDITVYCDQPAYAQEEDEGDIPSEMLHRGIRIKRVRVMGEHREGGTASRALRATTYLFSTIRALVRDRKQYDGLLVTTNPPFGGLAGWFMSVWFGKPYVQLVYDVYPDIAERLGVIDEGAMVAQLWEQGTRLMLREAAATVVIGRDMAEVVREKLYRRNWGTLHLIPNWSDETVVEPIPRQQNPFRDAHGIDGQQFLVQYAGRMGTTHNLEPLIEAAVRVRDTPIQFQFIGDGAKKGKLQSMVEDRALDNVTFLPYQPLDELGDVLSAADVAVVCLETPFKGLSVPSKTYGIMASGTPLLGILDPKSEIGMVVREEECGVVLEDPSGSEVARVLRALVEEPDKMQRMARNAREAFERNYTLSHAAQKYDAVLRRYIYGSDTVQLVREGKNGVHFHE